MDTHKFKSEMPELIDLKITDYCENGCPFCYQGSTPGGKHANTKFVKNLIYSFRKMGVFEVVIGGGDPTKHPDLISILEACRSCDLVPNMTISSHQVDWLTTEEGKKVSSLLGAIAISASDPENLDGFLEKVHLLLDKKSFNTNYGINPRGSVRIQAVEELYTNEQLMSILRFQEDHYLCGATFVGYKTIGRGRIFNKKKDSNLIQVIKEYLENCKKKDPDYFEPVKSWFTCSIDTVLAKKYEKELVDTLGVDPILFNTYDGLNSCYIDAINKAMNSSSYASKPGIYIGYDKENKWRENDSFPWRELLEIFSTFTEE